MEYKCQGAKPVLCHYIAFAPNVSLVDLSFIMKYENVFLNSSRHFRTNLHKLVFKKKSSYLICFQNRCNQHSELYFLKLTICIERSYLKMSDNNESVLHYSK